MRWRMSGGGGGSPGQVRKAKAMPVKARATTSMGSRSSALSAFRRSQAARRPS